MGQTLTFDVHAEDIGGRLMAFSDAVTIYFDQDVNAGHRGVHPWLQFSSVGFYPGSFTPYDLTSNFSREIYFPKAGGDGVYHITKVGVKDAAGNIHDYLTDELASMGINTSFTVSSKDVAAPALSWLSLPRVMDVRGFADTDHLFFQGYDEVGLKSASIVFDKPFPTGDKPSSTLNFQFPGKAGGGEETIDTIVSLPTSTPADAYRIVKVTITDLAGNTTTLSAADLAERGFNTKMQVVSATPGPSGVDKTPPELLLLDHDSAFDIAVPVGSPYYYARVDDAGLGVERVVVHFDRLVGNGASTTLDLGPVLVGSHGEVLFGRAFEFFKPGPGGFPSSEWIDQGSFNIDRVFLLDYAGNTRVYLADELRALGYDTSIDIESSKAPVTTLAAIPRSEPGKVIVAVSANQSAPVNAPFEFKLSYTGAMSLQGWRYAGSDQLHPVSNEAGAWKVSSLLGATGSATDTIELVFTSSASAGNFTYALRGAVLGTKSLADMSASYTYELPLYVNGTGGADRLTGGAGSDRFDGGAGLDTVVYAGASANYVVKAGAHGFTVTGRGGATGTDVLNNIERIAFDGSSIALDIDGAAGQAYRIYQAAFNRAPDAKGLGYWIRAMDEGMSLSAVAALFVETAEFKAMYADSTSNSKMLTKFYENVLHRQPDAGGYAYWLSLLDTKTLTPAAVLATISESAENHAALIGAMENGIGFLPYY
jgi:hypothetical protein